MNIAAVENIALPCPACRAPTDIVAEGLYDDRYGYPDMFALFRCKACGHQHIPTNFTPDDLGRLYTQYYPRGNFDLKNFRPEVEKSGLRSWLNGDRSSAFRWVPRNVRVLDIGCGLGTTLAYHRARGCEAVGMEADANVQAVAARYGLDIRQGIFDGTQFESDVFDYVTLDQVAEHVVDPRALLNGVARVLKPGGKVIITTPNPRSLGARLFGRKWINWHVPYHIQFYTPKSLALVARQAGLEIERHTTITATAWQLYQWYHVLAFPPRGTRHMFWSSGRAPEGNRFTRFLVAFMKRLDAQIWISRALDLMGLGDNHVFVLRKP
jgi:SAM-dependent methyltransferase